MLINWQGHYADGDLVNSETLISHMQAGPETLSVWGPPVPEVFQTVPSME